MKLIFDISVIQTNLSRRQRCAKFLSNIVILGEWYHHKM
jgi:hypothetical protein